MTKKYTSKNAVLRKAVLPTVLLVGLGGSALVATPAFAAEPVTAPTDAATSAPTADPTAPATAAPATTAPTSDPSATATSAPVATPAPAAAKAPAIAPKAHAAAAAPTDLTVTSPVMDDDYDPIVIHGARTVTITGTAPIGSRIVITNDNGDQLARFTNATASFTTTVTFADDAPYEQSIYVDAKYKGEWLTEGFVIVDFDAPTSATPTVSVPAMTSFETAPLPFGFGTLGNPVTLTGTGTAGDEISLYFDKPGDAPGTDANSDSIGDGPLLSDLVGLGAQFSEIVVGKDGTWSGKAYLGYGDVTVTATDTKFDADYYSPITHESGYSNGVDLSMKVPAGTVLPPRITTPQYDFDDLFSISTTDASDGVSSGGGETGASAPASVLSRLAVPADAAVAMKADSMPTKADPVVAAQAHVKAVAAAAAESVADPVAAATAAQDATDTSGSTADDGSGDGSDDPSSDTPETPAQINQDAVDYGVQVKGTPSTSRHGKLDITVSGTGTPGDGIVLQSILPSASDAYYAALYPKFFAGLDSASADLGDFFSSIPSDPGTVASLLPVDDHTITVKADGTWTTTFATVPGPAYLAAFSTNPAGTFSVASEPLTINVTGTPIVDPAGITPTELAFTGSDDSPLGVFGLLALGLGAALVFVTRRRRRLGDSA